MKHTEIKKVLKMYIKSRGLRPSLIDPFDGWADINDEIMEAIEDDRMNMTMKDF